jgi:hypothetical protein
VKEHRGLYRNAICLTGSRRRQRAAERPALPRACRAHLAVAAALPAASARGVQLRSHVAAVVVEGVTRCGVRKGAKRGKLDVEVGQSERHWLACGLRPSPA